MTKKKKIILMIIAVVLALAAYGYFFGFQTVCAVSFRMMRKPQQDVVPKPMTLEPCSVPVTVLKAFDYSFSVPWSDCSQYSAKTSSLVWTCSMSNFYVICSAPRASAYGLILSDTLGEYEQYRPTVESLLGLGNVVHTNFYICKKVWEMAPEDISPFDSKDTVVAKCFLLALKAIGISPYFRDAYFFERGNIKGFQLGSPSVSRCVELSIFDQMDREICLIVDTSTNSPVRLTQADINTIITTFSSEP